MAEMTRLVKHLPDWLLLLLLFVCAAVMTFPLFLLLNSGG